MQSLRSLLYPADMALAHAALARFDVADKLFERVDRLSGGERQRVGLARGLVADASLFLVDEPLSALDPSRAEQAITSLTQAAREKNATLVASLHHVQIALAHFPRIIGLQGGELVFDLPASQVSPERLHQLYASKLDELTGPAPADDLPLPVGTAAAVMHCR
jgi:phosphonate transport system ATP-binding protein